MKYFLDTNICIYYLKGTHRSVADKLVTLHPEDIRIASIVKAELLYGAYRSVRKDANLVAIEEFLLPFEVVDFGDSETIHYAEIRSTLEANGEIIGPNDLIVAATARSNDGILVTHNEREFSRVPDLKLDNWVG